MRARMLLVVALMVVFSLPGEADEEPSFADRVKGLTSAKGFYTLYAAKKLSKVLGVVPSAQIGKPFLLAVSIARGPYAGWQWADMLVTWEVQGKKLVLVRPDVRYRARKGTPLAAAVERTYTESVVTSVDVLAKDGSGGFLVDMAGIFFSDLGGLTGVFGERNTDLTRWGKAKVFPHNVELGVDQVFAGGQRIRVHYSLRALPSTSSYKPREADDRVGYFLTAIKDYRKKHNAPTSFSRYLQRWRLEKVDSSLKVSPPKQPIVFYIEKTVPYRFRRYVREGILEWNKAFEKVGFVSAIVVRQQTQTEFADLDPEDARYNFFRWGTSGEAFAMGPSRVDPRTGEILDADIFFDDMFVRYQAGEYRTFSPVGFGRLGDRKLTEFLTKHPEWHPIRGLRNGRPKGGGQQMSRLVRLALERRRPLCLCGYEKARQLALSGVALAASTGKIPEIYVGQTIKETVMHEVGHTLGLRHNFKASSWRSVEEITRKKPVEVLSGSVMDYNAVNFSIDQKGNNRLYQMTTLGPYDYWAIEYGYAAAPDKAALVKIAQRGARKGLAYATDEDSTTFDPDPLSNVWDLGSDPVAYASYRLKLVGRLMSQLIDRSVKKGSSYQHARRAFNVLFFEYFQAAQLAARFVGGQYVHRDHRGDPNERPPFVLVSRKKQLAALDFLDRHIFSKGAFRFSPSLLNHLGPGRWDHWGSDQYDEWLEYPIHEKISAVQSTALFLLFNPFAVSRLHDNQLKSGDASTRFTLGDLFGRVDGIIWRELDNKEVGQPYIVSTRRSLQRKHLNLLVDQALGKRFGVLEEAKTLSYRSLVLLGRQIDQVMNSQAVMDAESQAHLMESQQRIKSALKAYFQRN